MKDEEAKYSKLKLEERELMSRHLATETAEVLKHHEDRMAVIVGRMLAWQARKQAVPSAKLDTTVDRMQVSKSRRQVAFMKQIK